MQPQTFVFFGIVGSGKGTQAKLLCDFVKNKDGKECLYIGTGEIFRKMMESGEGKEMLNSGKLMPDDKTNDIVSQAVKSQVTSDESVVFDGYPRTVVQSRFFEELMQSYKRENIKIVYITLSEEEAMKRNLLRGRLDDTEGGLKKRFEEYRMNVVPAMEYFKGKLGYTIYTINGEQSVENVQKDIINALGY